LNHPDHVLPETKEKIESAIAELNYTPSVIARSLRTKKTGIVVVVMESITNPFFGEVFDILRCYLEKHGYKAMLHTISDYEFKTTDFSFADGIIICYPNNDDIITSVSSVTGMIPKVIMHGHAVEQDIESVIFDVGLGSHMAAEHLYNQGCRNFVIVGGEKQSSMSIEKTAAIREFLAAVEDSITCREIHGVNHFSGGILAAEKIHKELTDADAVLCESDALATGVISRLLGLGYHIPNDIKVVGYDNVPIAQMYHPSVTTVAIPTDEMSRTAANMITRLIEGKSVVRKTFEPVLMVRETG